MALDPSSAGFSGKLSIKIHRGGSRWRRFIYFFKDIWYEITQR